MTKEDVLKIAEETAPEEEAFCLSDIVSVSERIRPHLMMDEYSFDYFYSISLGEILKSTMTETEVAELFKKGWVYNSETNCVTKKI